MINLIFLSFLSLADVSRKASSLGLYQSKEDKFLELTDKYVELLIKHEELKDIVYECCYEQMTLMQREKFLRIIHIKSK